MRALMSLLGLLIVLVIGQFVYRSYFTGSSDLTMGTNNPRAAADITGVKNDLNAMAQAERAFMALNGRYAMLEELYSAGHLQIDPARERQGYTYSVNVSERGFGITAAYEGPAADMPTLFIDETMQIAQR